MTPLVKIKEGPDEPSLLFSQVPFQPSFRDAAVNEIAIVPLLCNETNDVSNSQSLKSFEELFLSLRRYAHMRSAVSKGSGGSLAYGDNDSILLIVPNSNLTRPGDWRYEKTPLRNFHWGHGCQRISVFDGRPGVSRRAHDRIKNTSTGKDWIDLCPWRRTAAVIGVLNMKDCPTVEHLRQAEEELNEWAARLAVPSFENQRKDPSSVHYNRAEDIVQRLFVFDSFDDECQKHVDLTKTKLGSNLVAFPPSDNEHTHMMDLHLVVVINDLSVAIFRKLEGKIRDADAITKGTGEGNANPFSFFTRGPTGVDGPLKYSSLSLKNITSVISPENELASGTPTNSGESQTFQSSFSTWTESSNRTVAKPTNRLAATGISTDAPQLLTPLDDVWEFSALSAKDADAMKRRNMARYEKWAADLCLLAGSPMDAYERHLHAAESCKVASDPLWYASSLEGCAAAHTAMAEVGGYEMVDQYLENNFTLPDEFMANAIVTAQEKGRQTMQSKQVLPTVVFALVEEAVNIVSRHAKLAPLHAELLLKMAWYAAELEERHLRCRWGDGEGSFLGDASENGARWERCSVYDLKFQAELKTKDGEDLLLSNTLQRCRKWTQFMHRAVLVGCLDAATRVDVAAACARMCLRGLQHTQWNTSSYPRLTCPRKAAYFTRVAAQTMSLFCKTGSAAKDMASLFQCNCLWLATCQLFSSKPNESIHSGSYGWAVLRASTLHSLSNQQDSIVAEAAAEALLTILSEIVPGQTLAYPRESRILIRGSEDESVMTDASQGASQDLDVSVRTSDPDPVVVRKPKSKTQPARGGFFANSTSSASLLTVAQSKWADDDPISSVTLPLTEDQQVVFLNCVTAQVKVDNSAIAQKRCLSHLSKLRMCMPTSSKGAFFSIYETNNQEGHLPPPFRIVSAEIVKPAIHMALERTKAHGFSGKAHLGAMATFFNPFDHEKKKAERKIQATLVAEGEEQSVLVEFKNLLSVPLDIPSCQLDFQPKGNERVKAPSMSFVIPAKAENFAIHFPFIVLAMDRSTVTDEMKEDSDDTPASADVADKFEVTGLKVTCCNRSFVIPVVPFDEETPSSVATNRQIAASGAIYPRLLPRKPSEEDSRIKPRLEAVPAQPNLLVSFTTSQTPIDDSFTTVNVHLSDGEIFTIPPFRLENDFGPSGLGTMQRLQISAVGLPGLPEEILFDTDTLAAAREKEEDELEDDSEEEEEEDEEKEDFEEMMVYDGLPPLKMKALCEGLDLKSINDKTKTRCDGSTVTFQVAATHDMGTQLANGGNVRIRFRYSGISPNPATEIWRKREIALRIVRVKGPRISSLTFRPDLTWGSAYSELCAALAVQKRERGIEVSHSAHENGTGGMDGDKSFLLNRVGTDSGVHVSADHVVVLMAVANETNSTIVLSNRKGLVGGFQASPMPTVRVTSGVSVKIPVVIPRISRINQEEEDGIMDIASELVTNTALQWETELANDAVDSEDGSSSTNGGRRNSIAEAATRRVRQGRVRIPRRCLKEIIADFPSFAARICVPPCTVKISIGRKDSVPHLSVAPGDPIDTFAEMQLADWVPREVVDKCTFALEFCCARKGATMIADLENPTRRREYVWCGRVQRTLRGDENDHRARICFLEPGQFVISACAKISSQDRVGEEETWWAPVAENVVVEMATLAAAQ